MKTASTLRDIIRSSLAAASTVFYTAAPDMSREIDACLDLMTGWRIFWELLMITVVRAMS